MIFLHFCCIFYFNITKQPHFPILRRYKLLNIQKNVFLIIFYCCFIISSIFVSGEKYFNIFIAIFSEILNIFPLSKNSTKT